MSIILNYHNLKQFFPTEYRLQVKGFTMKSDGKRLLLNQPKSGAQDFVAQTSCPNGFIIDILVKNAEKFATIPDDVTYSGKPC